jgi:hypothetical protein
MKHYIRCTISILLLFLSIGFLIFTIANLFVTLCEPSQKYELPADKNVISESYKILVSQVGVKETGYNSGFEVNQYLKSVGLNSGNAWCMSLQYYCFWKTGLKVPIKRSGNCQVVYEDAQKRGRQTSYKSKVHDLLIWRLGATRSGHVGRIVKDLGMGWVNTIEGNVGNPQGVYIIKRHISNPLARLRVRGLISFKEKQ